MHGGDDHSETSALLHSSHQHDSDDDEGNSHVTPILNKPTSRARVFVGSALILLFAAALVLVLGFEQSLPDRVRPWLGLLPKDPMTAALAILKVAPVIVSFSDPIHGHLVVTNHPGVTTGWSYWYAGFELDMPSGPYCLLSRPANTGS
jgi:hypothetical protein